MLDNQQKQTLAGAVVLMIILAVITLTSHPNFLYREKPSGGKASQPAVDAQKYLRYLESLKVDPKASQRLFEKVITEAEVRQEVENTLKVGQTISQPPIDTVKLGKSSAQGQQPTVDYLAKLTGSALNFNTQAKALNSGLFSADGQSLRDLRQRQQKVLDEFYALAAPPEAGQLQQAVVKAFAAYGELIDAALIYAEKPNSQPWPGLYKAYAVINQQFQVVNAEVNKLASQYNLAALDIRPVYAFAPAEKKFHLIHQAQAFLGLGDVSITIGDVPRIIKETIEEGLTTSFATFMGEMLNQLIAKIESNYLIANFLYYTDALVAGQYADDYLQKYVNNQLDRQIVKRFIPQLACGASPQNLQPVFQAKAKEYLGFDVNTLSPSDPDYYEKLARVGDFMSSPYGWQEYYEGVAAEAESAAEKAAEKELTSAGLKTPRDTVNSAIAISVNNIVSASRASLNAAMNLGINNAKSFISGFVSQLTQNLVNKFVFRGVVSQNGSLGVLKEQKICLAAAQFQAVLPMEAAQYQPPPAPPTQEDLLQQECAKFPRGCNVLPAPSP